MNRMERMEDDQYQNAFLFKYIFQIVAKFWAASPQQHTFVLSIKWKGTSTILFFIYKNIDYSSIVRMHVVKMAPIKIWLHCIILLGIIKNELIILNFLIKIFWSWVVYWFSFFFLDQILLVDRFHYSWTCEYTWYLITLFYSMWCFQMENKQNEKKRNVCIYVEKKTSHGVEYIYSTHK